jgi:DNA-directed RNA polymerase subunit RPC12/RpoP
MNRTDIENLVTICFAHCPFCQTEGSLMRFEWGNSIPRSMICSNCEAKWELLFGLDKDWSFLGAKLVDTGSTKKGANLKGKLYDTRFWKKTVLQGVSEKPLSLERERVPSVAERTIIIREIVKIRCPYCGGLYDEPKDRCPYCGGKR